jgi:hypothetical protein
MVRRDGARVRCFTRNGHDWADRFPAIVDAALRIQASSFLIDGKAVIARDDGTPDFRALRSKRRGSFYRRRCGLCFGGSVPVIARYHAASDCASALAAARSDCAR